MKSSFKSMKQQGFTLIEIAIVLVIIGLLVGGVLQGQELIENSRVKQAVKDINGTSAAMLAYQDRYGRLPGDDGPQADLTGRGAAWAGVAGDNDGRFEARRTGTFTGGDEVDSFWRQLRAAGFISGDPTDTGVLSMPSNPWGGRIGMTVESVLGGLAGTKVCLSEVPGSGAIAIDNQLDDGSGATGRVRGSLGVAASHTAPTTAVLAGGGAYSEDNIYSVCYRM